MVVKVRLLKEPSAKEYWFNMSDVLFGKYIYQQEGPFYLLVDTAMGYKVGVVTDINEDCKAPDGLIPERSVVSVIPRQDIENFTKEENTAKLMDMLNDKVANLLNLIKIKTAFDIPLVEKAAYLVALADYTDSETYHKKADEIDTLLGKIEEVVD